MISTQYINLNMVPSGVMPVLHCSQYDVGRPLGVVIYNGSESVDLSGYTVTIEGTRTDRTPVTAGVITDGNIGVFTTTPTMTNENDTYRAKVVLTDNAGRVSSLAFVMCVDEKTMDENAEEIEEDASLYQQYTGTVQTIIAQIRGDLAAEITARQNAISAEASARQAADNTLQSNINAETSTRATQDASLQSQINQLIAPSGSAPSAAEVENARIGSDGTVYPTLGDAIRTQNSLLKSHLTPYSAIGFNMSDEEWVDGYYNTSTGAAVNATGLIRTKNAIPVEPGVEYCITRIDGTTVYLLWYKADGTYISGGPQGVGSKHYELITPPTEAAQLRMYMYGSAYNGTVCFNVSQKDIAISPKNGDYVPYLPLDIRAKITSNAGAITRISDVFNALLDLEGLPNSFIQGTAYVSNGIDVFQDSTTRVRQIFAKYPGISTIVAKPGYSIGVHVCTFDGVTYHAVEATGWVTSYKMPYDSKQYFVVIVARKTNDATITPEEGNANIIIYSDLLNSLGSAERAYEYDGEVIDLNRNTYNAIKGVTIADSNTGKATQGGAVYNGILFQFQEGYIVTYNLSDGSLISAISATVGHGNSGQFSNEFYDTSDAYPLLYISGCTDRKVYVYRVTTTTATLIKTIQFSGETEGYTLNAAVDGINNRLITIGTYLNDAMTRSGNHMIVSIFDLDDLTETETTGVYTAALIKRYTMPFIFVVQDCKYYNGRLVALSSGDITATAQYNENPTWIYFIDPYKETVTAILKAFPSELSDGEGEVLEYVPNSVNLNKYDIFVELQSRQTYLISA